MTRLISKGKCYLCGDSFSKTVMTRHLKLCKKKKGVFKTPPSKGHYQKTECFHIVVEDRYRPDYWMHLEIPTNTEFGVLDDFLREIWLECCGHLSVFEVEGERYASDPMEEYEEESMDVLMGDVLSSGMKFYHDYDFGTTTELKLRVISEEESETKDESIQLLARNDPPSIICMSCKKIATQVCSGCIWSGGGWLCDECAEKHECGEEMLLPVVNSPRVGMCGYTG